ncbi:unnamed protein product [Eretmochelys imbricata]
MQRIKQVFKKYSGINNAEEDAKQATMAAFVQELNLLRDQLKIGTIDWEGKNPDKILVVAQHYYRQVEKKKDDIETKLMTLQIQNILKPHSNRPLRGRGGRPNRGPHHSSTQGQGNDACYCCGQVGHWKSNCPSRFNQPINPALAPQYSSPVPLCPQNC